MCWDQFYGARSLINFIHFQRIHLFDYQDRCVCLIISAMHIIILKLFKLEGFFSTKQIMLF